MTAVLIPDGGRPARSTFVKLGARRYLVISIVMVALVVTSMTPERIVRPVSPSAPVRRSPAGCRRLSAGADRKRPGLGLAGPIEAEHLGALSPIDDVRGTADYRRDAALTCCAGRSWNSADERRSDLFPLNGTTVDGGRPSRAARLADVLREELGLTGTKIGCNAGDCGACTVLLDGEQVCACLVAVGQVAGRAVTTVEGLGAGRRLERPAARPFIGTAPPNAASARPGCSWPRRPAAAQHRPSEAEVQDALGGVLCRCTGYRKIVEAVLDGNGHARRPCRRAPQSGPRLAKVDGIAENHGGRALRRRCNGRPMLWLRAPSARRIIMRDSASAT